jgi:hypothetical protein
LNELREQAIDLRFDLALSIDAGGERVGELIGDLTVAVGSHPEREHRAAALAIALYRAGRHVESLAVMRDTRVRLRELGLTPGPRLDELEGQVLRHDPALTGGGRPADRREIDEVARSLRAVETLLREGASDIAEVMAERAVEAARKGTDPATIAQALVTHAHAASVNGATPVDGLLAEAQAIAREVNDGYTLARAALVRFGSGVPVDWNSALVELTEPLDLLPTDAGVRVDLLSAAAAVVAFSDAGPHADRVVQAAEATHRAIATPRTEAVLAAVTTIVDAVAARPDAGAHGRAERSLELARASGDPALVVVALHALLRTGFSAGHLDAIESLLPELQDASRRAGLAFGLARGPLCRSSIALARGDFEAVPDHIAAARSIGRGLRAHASEPSAVAQEMLLMHETGRLGEAIDQIRRLRTLDPGGPWLAIAALGGDRTDDQCLLDGYRAIPRSDRFHVTVALSALVAADMRDGELGTWCHAHLTTMGDANVMVGFGAVVLGPARTFVGAALLAADQPADAAIELERAVKLADEARASAWQLAARLWHAEALWESGRSAVAVRLLIDIDRHPLAARSKYYARRATRLRRRFVQVEGSAATPN